ncbi:MAG: S-methyl-5-thioribose-1-phosphate isomerase [Pseudolabrys sp.]
MRVNGKHYRTIWLADDGSSVDIIDQTLLPHRFATVRLREVGEMVRAIKTMQVRGAPLIGAAAAYGICLAIATDSSDEALDRAYDALLESRPTAVNLRWALDAMRAHLRNRPRGERVVAAYQRAAEICEQDIAINNAVGDHGLKLFRAAEKKEIGGPLNVLTHCNAGWLAAVDLGIALAPVYKAHNAGMPIHVWVDETRPRNQGMSLTAWELGQHGVPHTVIADNAGGHLMQHGKVDLAIVGTDRTTARGDVCNKIGTYLKALAAKDNGVPFYVAAPSPSIDWTVQDGVKDIPIEQRDGAELSLISGRLKDGSIAEVNIAPDGSAMANYAFDVTPAHLVTALITERGVCAASADGLRGLFPEQAPKAQRAGDAR